MQKLLLALILVTTIRVSAQSALDGRWAADVPTADGVTIPFILDLSVDDETVLGRLKIGGAESVRIEGGRLRGEVLSFQRTLEDGSRIVFLARLVDGTLRVGMMPVPAGETPSSVDAPQVVNFTARRADDGADGSRRFGPFRTPR